MDWEDNVTQFHLTTIARIRQYCEMQGSEQEPDLEIKRFNAAKSRRLAGGMVERTAQKWAKRLKEDKDWNILEKQTNLVNRPKPQLRPEHKTLLVNSFDNPQTRLTDAVDSLTHNFADFKY
ncbi:uncharacterized protein EV154DRAFT_592674 [Mucor mucedo]|uniref:uncharacterized protein n=1 Tax=Mucor mucedo TaxID=29922 RepID=UPI00221EF2CD|nr:uncharacterized protein EV154DRAFT_592674 [Mucor mucedo]KAI7889107.1 hypothetical protein EV154DRAFT_592674 [Mucor mucedo]